MIWQNSCSHFSQKFLQALSTLPFSFHPSPCQHFSSLALTLIRTRTFSASPLKRVIAISTHGCCYDHKIKPEFATALYEEGVPEKLDLVADCTMLTCTILHCFQQIYAWGFICVSGHRYILEIFYLLVMKMLYVKLLNVPRGPDW